MLVGFPAAYLFGSACLDACAAAAHRPGLHKTARHLGALGIASALIAAIPGIVDYLTAVPPRSSAKTRATDHLIANVSALTLFGAARLGRNANDDRPAAWALAAELCGAGLVAVAGWLGGTLVFRNQIGVDHRYANAGKWQSPMYAPRPTGDGSIDVGSADQLQTDQMKLLHVGDERIALARTESGFAAFSDRCTHKGGPLSDGTLACGVVQCPWHGSQFDVTTGEVRQGPAVEPVETVAVRRMDDRIQITPSRRAAPLKSIS
jgi:nitrite reductase/ring-hydroxylating ferredoxin subunit/uncharacterized membrane protein